MEYLIVSCSTGLLLAYVIITQYIKDSAKGSFLSSLSESYYVLEELHKGLGSIFMILLMIILPFSLFPVMIKYTPDNFGIITLLTVFGIMLVGAAPLFKTYDKKVHTTGAIMAAVFAFIWSLLVGTLWVWAVGLIRVLGIFILHCNYGKVRDFYPNLLFWGEMIVFFSIFISLFTLID